MIDRIKIVIEYYNLTASNFADKIEVPRSSISHLLSGRNKPSLDFVMKIVNTFPEVDLYWLLKNEGTFPKEKEKEKTENVVFEKRNDKKEDSIAPSLFSENIVFEQQPEKKSNTQFSEVIRKQTTGKKINRIVLFFNDGSFEAYEQ